MSNFIFVSLLFSIRINNFDWKYNVCFIKPPIIYDSVKLILQIRQKIKAKLMKPLSHRTISSSQKQNLNWLNGIASPDPSRYTKMPFKESNTERKCLVRDIDYSELCHNNDRRMATHCINEGEGKMLKYCEKCSIMLASKGFNIEKLPLSYGKKINKPISKRCENELQANKRHQKIHRSEIISEFKTSLKCGERDLSNKYQQIQNILFVSEDKYCNLIEQINEYFSEIQQMVDYQKCIAYNKVLTERVKNETEVRNLKKYIQEVAEQLEGIEQDLVQNKQVANYVSSEQFNSIISAYKDRINDISEIMSFDVDIIYYECIHLPDFPASLSKISDYIAFNQGASFRNSLEINLLKLNNDMVMNSFAQDPENIRDCIQNLSEHTSEHSFNIKNHQKEINLSKRQMQKIPQTNSKQILLQNSFSLASSIANQDFQSFQQGQHNLFIQQNKKNQTNTNLCNFFYKTYKSEHVLGAKIDGSLSQYLTCDERVSLQQVSNTLNQDNVNETMLLIQ